MFEELRKSYASYKKAKEDAAKRYEQLRNELDEFKTLVKQMWQEGGLPGETFKLKGGELVIDEKNQTVSLKTANTSLSRDLLQQAASAVNDYLSTREAKLLESWTR